MLPFFFLLLASLLSETASAEKRPQSNAENGSIAKGKIFATWLLSYHDHVLPKLGKEYRNDFSPGLMVQGAVTDYSAIEVSLYAIKKIVYRKMSETEYTHERLQSLYISSGYRHWFYDWLSIGAGIWSSYSMGDPETLGREDTTSFSLANYETSAENFSLTGLDFSVSIVGPSVALWNNWEFSPTIKYRYALAMTVKKDEKADHRTASLGMRFWIKR